LQKGNTKITPSVAARQGELAGAKFRSCLFFFFEELFFLCFVVFFFSGAEYKIKMAGNQ